MAVDQVDLVIAEVVQDQMEAPISAITPVKRLLVVLFLQYRALALELLVVPAVLVFQVVLVMQNATVKQETID